MYHGNGLTSMQVIFLGRPRLASPYRLTVRIMIHFWIYTRACYYPSTPTHCCYRDYTTRMSTTRRSRWTRTICYRYSLQGRLSCYAMSYLLLTQYILNLSNVKKFLYLFCYLWSGIDFNICRPTSGYTQLRSIWRLFGSLYFDKSKP